MIQFESQASDRDSQDENLNFFSEYSSPKPSPMKTPNLKKSSKTEDPKFDFKYRNHSVLAWPTETPHSSYANGGYKFILTRPSTVGFTSGKKRMHVNGSSKKDIIRRVDQFIDGSEIPMGVDASGEDGYAGDTESNNINSSSSKTRNETSDPSKSSATSSKSKKRTSDAGKTREK